MKNGVRKLITAVLAAMIAVIAFACGDVPTERQPLTADRLYATYAPYAVELREGANAGSGFIAAGEGDDVYIVSCFHVAKTVVPNIKFHGETENLTAASTRIIGYDEKTDIIVYRTSKSGFDGKGVLSPYAISDRTEGKEVAVIASPYGDGVSYLESKVSLAEDVRNIGGVNRLVTRISGGIYDGSSGGMAIDKYGAFVGMAIGRNAEATGNDMCYVTSAETVAAVYESIRRGKVTDGAGTTYKFELIRPDFSVSRREVTTDNVRRDVKEIVREENGKTYRFEYADGKLYLLGYEYADGKLTRLGSADARGTIVDEINGVRADTTFARTVAGLLRSGTTDFYAETGGERIPL